MSEFGALKARMDDLEEQVEDLGGQVRQLQPALSRAIDHHTACGLQLQNFQTAFAEQLKELKTLADKLALVAAELGADS